MVDKSFNEKLAEQIARGLRLAFQNSDVGRAFVVLLGSEDLTVRAMREIGRIRLEVQLGWGEPGVAYIEVPQ